MAYRPVAMAICMLKDSAPFTSTRIGNSSSQSKARLLDAFPLSAVEMPLQQIDLEHLEAFFANAFEPPG
ncbi:MAG TPA: hypothetical protein DCZ41_00925 [Firmicutes bacterium]|nr:hypothetical protein [Bacillota bacterium]